MRILIFAFTFSISFLKADASIEIIDENLDQSNRLEKNIIEILDSGEIFNYSSGFFDHHIDGCRDIGGIMRLEDKKLTQSSLSLLKKNISKNPKLFFRGRLDGENVKIKKTEETSKVVNLIKKFSLNASPYSLVKVSSIRLGTKLIQVTFQYSGEFPFGIWIPADINKVFRIKKNRLEHIKSNRIGGVFLDKENPIFEIKIKTAEDLVLGDQVHYENGQTRNKKVSAGIILALSPYVKLCSEILF